MNFAVNSAPRIGGRILRSKNGDRTYSVSTTQKLFYRELHGFSKRSSHCHVRRKMPLDVLPRRFAFPITSLVDDYNLHEEGHVFLGFSSCDRFLISYTESLEVANHTGFLSHIYTLHWWLWNPSCKAKKVGSVRLFANEEIECSLFLCYAEWPTSKGHVVVYGWRKHCDSGYITIATVPSLTPCTKCDKLRSNVPPDEEEPSKSLCIEHGYTMHFKQASGASQTGVLNSSGLKIDGVLVLNIGHSVAVLSTGHLSGGTDLENLPLSSIKRRACEDTIDESDMKEVSEFDQLPQEEPSVDSTICRDSVTFEAPAKHIVSADSLFVTSKENTQSSTCLASVYDLDNDECDPCERISLNCKTASANKENIESNHCENFECQISIDLDPYYDPEPKSIVLGGSSTKDDPQPHAKPGEPVCVKCGSSISRSSNSNFCFCTLSLSSHSMQGPGGELDQRGKNFWRDGQSSGKSKCTTLPFNGNTSVLNERQNAIDNSRFELNFMTPSPTTSDGSSSVQFPESGFPMNNGKTSSTERNSDGLVSFCETFYGPIHQDDISEDEPLPVGETGFQLCTMFCQGAAGEMLHPLEKGNPSIQAYSQHLVLDVEHVIFDILRTRCYTAYKYGYLVDYEANILDVCSATKSVVIHVAALLNVQRNRMRGLTSVPSERSVSQQAEFILCWSLSTGRYEVVVARPLQPYDVRKCGEWNGDWIVRIDSLIRRKCAVLADPYKSVYILDNSAVLRERSVDVLWNCDKTLAITR